MYIHVFRNARGSLDCSIDMPAAMNEMIPSEIHILPLFNICFKSYTVQLNLITFILGLIFKGEPLPAPIIILREIWRP